MLGNAVGECERYPEYADEEETSRKPGFVKKGGLAVVLRALSAHPGEAEVELQSLRCFTRCLAIGLDDELEEDEEEREEEDEEGEEPRRRRRRIPAVFVSPLAAASSCCASNPPTVLPVGRLWAAGPAAAILRALLCVCPWRAASLRGGRPASGHGRPGEGGGQRSAPRTGRGCVCAQRHRQPCEGER